MIAVDSKGMLYLAGSFVYDIDADPGQNTAMLTNSGQEDMYVACYDGSKTPANNSFYRWAFKIEHSSSNNILATNDGSVYVTGLTNDEQDLDPGSNVHATKGNFVAKYDGTKSIDNTNFFKWSFQVPDGAQVENYFIDSKNALYLTGQILRGYDCDFDPSINNDTLKVTNSNNDYFLLAKYDLTKNPDDTTFYQWAFDIGGESYFGDNFIGKDIAVDSTGLIYVLGTAAGAPYTLDIDPGAGDNYVEFNPNNQQTFLFMYDGTKKPTDSSFCQGGFTIGGGVTQNDVIGNSMHIDSAGNILIGGSFKSKYTDFDPTSGEFGLTSVCNGLGADAFIVKYSPFYITPLSDLKLSGKQQDDKIRLDWQTVAEITTSSFEIEWSDTDTTSFKKIATANAVDAGNNAYQYFHLNLSKGKNFYRLKIVDKNGGYTNSEIVEIFYSQFELLKFSATEADDKARLDWETHAELNTSVFEVQWSATDTLSFKRIGTVNAVGNEDNIYQYFHEDPLTGRNFYRLKIMDKDGSFIYSDIEEITFSEESDLVVKIGPNPVNTNLTFYITSDENTTGLIEVMNAEGKLGLSKNIEIPAGNSVQHIYTTALERGLYFVRITTPGQRIFLRFIK